MSKMKGFAMLGIGKTGWIEKDVPECGPLDAIVKPLAVSPCTSDVHTVWEGAIGDRKDMILGHEAVGEIVEVGNLVKTFKAGDRVIVPAITPDWGALESQAGYSMHSNGMLAGWKFSNFKDGVFAEYFHVNEADALSLIHILKRIFNIFSIIWNIACIFFRRFVFIRINIQIFFYRFIDFIVSHA